LNAASNHAVELPKISWEVWQQRLNRVGFFWLEVVGDERIVRHV